MTVIADIKKLDPLDRLFVKGDEVNRELLGNLLLNYVRLDEKGNIFPLTPFFSQTNKNKVIILLLAKKALSLKTGTSEFTSPSELSKHGVISGGSVRPTLGILVDEKLVEEEDSQYRIFSHAIPRCAELIESKSVSDEISESRLVSKRDASKMSMRTAIDDLIRQGGLDEGKTVRDILGLVLQRRPGTTYSSLYKIILDMTSAQKLIRTIQDDTWYYRRAK